MFPDPRLVNCSDNLVHIAAKIHYIVPATFAEQTTESNNFDRSNPIKSLLDIYTE